MNNFNLANEDFDAIVRRSVQHLMMPNVTVGSGSRIRCRAPVSNYILRTHSKCYVEVVTVFSEAVTKHISSFVHQSRSIV